MNKEVYFEFDLVDKNIQKIKNSQNYNEERSISNRDIENVRTDLREVKLKLEKLNDELAQKSNIKDVCVLVDMKANIDDVDKTFEDIVKDM